MPQKEQGRISSAVSTATVRRVFAVVDCSCTVMVWSAGKLVADEGGGSRQAGWLQKGVVGRSAQYVDLPKLCLPRWAFYHRFRISVSKAQFCDAAATVVVPSSETRWRNGRRVTAERQTFNNILRTGNGRNSWLVVGRAGCAQC